VGIGLGVVLGLTRTRPASRPPDANNELALHGQAQWAPGTRHAPDFALQSSAGGLVSLHSERRHILLLTFLDSRCKRACPLEGRALGQVGSELRRLRVPATLVVVTVDPWGDTRKSIRKFMRESRWRFPWRWLGGSPTRLRSVWRAYGIDVKQVPGDIAHSTVLYVLDPRGDLRIAYLFPFVPREVAQDIRHLARSV